MIFIRNSALLAIVFLSLGLSGCETVDGAGRDLENAGEAVQKSSR